jgi:glycine hydroxymethyltransferase
MIFPGIQGGPLMHVIAAKAVALLEALQPEFTIYQKQVIANAQAMADTFIEQGFQVVSKGTDNHLFLLDLIDKGLTGKEADLALGSANITVNKNTVPNDPQSPFVTSGIRIGTAAITTRGMKEEQARQLTLWMCEVLANPSDADMIVDVQKKVVALCEKFPVYQV